MALHVGRSRLPELYEARHITQAEFSRMLGVSEAFLSNVKNGKKYFSYELSVNAAKILRCTVEKLHEWYDEEGNRLEL